MPFDPYALRILKAIVDQGGFTRGAEAAHVTQSAASQAIRRLEAFVGTSLVARGRPPGLTPAGRRLYDHATDLLARDAAVMLDLEEIRQGGRGVLSLGASQALSR